MLRLFSCLCLLVFLLPLKASADRSIYISGVQGTPSYFIINGATNPILQLQRGETYHIKISSPSLSFSIKTQPSAQASVYTRGLTLQSTSSGNNSTSGVTDGVLIWSVSHDAPSRLYYGCDSQPSVANIIQIEDDVPYLGVWYNRHFIPADGTITVDMSSDNAPLKFELTNIGDAPLTISSIQLSSDKPGAKLPIVVSSRGAEVLPHTVLTFTVAYSAPFAGYLNIQTDDVQVLYSIRLEVLSNDSSSSVDDDTSNNPPIIPQPSAIPQFVPSPEQIQVIPESVVASAPENNTLLQENNTNNFIGSQGKWAEGKSGLIGGENGQDGSEYVAQGTSMVFVYAAVPVAALFVLILSVAMVMAILRKRKDLRDLIILPSLASYYNTDVDIPSPTKLSTPNPGPDNKEQTHHRDDESSSEMEIIAIDSSESESGLEDESESEGPTSPVPKLSFSRRF